MNKSASSIIGILLLFLTVVLINGLSRVVFNSAYWDLTEEGLYSLSDGTKSVVGNLDSKVTLRLYFSKTLTADVPSIKLYGQRISDLLMEYKRLGGDRLEVELIDPAPDSEEEEWAQRYGITPMTTPQGSQLFLGLAGTNEKGTEEVIPLFDLSRQETLEYDITKLILSLGRPDKKKVVIISSLPLEGKLNPQAPQYPGQPFGNQPWFFITQLKTIADVSFLEKGADVIPEGTDLLMVIHPKSLSEATLYAIDQFLMRGGSLFVAVDPYCQSDTEQSNPANPLLGDSGSKNSNLELLFRAWGMTLKEGAVGDKLFATPVNAGRSYPENFPLFVSVQELEGVEGEPSINKSNVITNDLETVLFPWVGSFGIEKKEGITVEPLFSSTTESMIYASTDYELGGGSPSEIRDKFVPSGEQFVLAALLHGNFTTAFPEGKPGEELKTEALESSIDSTHRIQSEKKSYVVVVADADFLSDTYSVAVQNIFGAQFATKVNDNLTFTINAVENLLGSDELISLRSRGKFVRPFDRVQEIERQAEARWQEEEKQLEQSLEASNARLNELQRGSAKEVGELMTQTALDEVKRFKEERLETMRRLREVRRSLRQDKQSLGNQLFLLNTFAVPLVLVIVALALHYRRRRK